MCSIFSSPSMQPLQCVKYVTDTACTWYKPLPFYLLYMLRCHFLIGPFFIWCFLLIYGLLNQYKAHCLLVSHLVCSSYSLLVHSLLCQGMQVLPLYHPLSLAEELVGRYDLNIFYSEVLSWLLYTPIKKILHAEKAENWTHMLQKLIRLMTCHCSIFLVHDHLFKHCEYQSFFFLLNEYQSFLNLMKHQFNIISGKKMFLSHWRRRN